MLTHSSVYFFHRVHSKHISVLCGKQLPTYRKRSTARQLTEMELENDLAASCAHRRPGRRDRTEGDVLVSRAVGVCVCVLTRTTQATGSRG